MSFALEALMNAVFAALSRRPLVTSAAAVTCAWLVGCQPLPSPSPLYMTGYRIVFPTVAAGPTTIDGQANEPAWASGFYFIMEDGGSFPAASLRGVADAEAIYLHARVDDANFNAEDVVVIGLNPDNTAGGYHRIHVFPCKPTGSCLESAAGQNATVEYWTGSFAGTSFTWTSVPVATSGIQAATRTFTDPSNASIKWWEVEVKVPRGPPFDFIDTNFFGFFVDVIRTDPDAGLAGEAVQYTWPPDQFIGSTNEDDVLSELDTGTLPPSAWGNATLSEAFGNGVAIRGNEIRTNHESDPSKIRLDGPNIFFATAANYTTAGGTLVTANEVTATFKIANHGLPSLGTYAPIPVSGNPTAAVNIPPTVAHEYETGAWNLTPAQRADYEANPSQCIRVELSSTNPSTIFVNTSAMRNMVFVEATSPFRELAMLSTQGARPRPGENHVAFTLRETFVNFNPRLPWATQLQNARRDDARRHVFHVEARPGPDHMLGVEVDPPRIQLPRQRVQIAPGTGGRGRPPVRLAVRPNEVLTFITSGSIDIDGEFVTAAGTPQPDKPPQVRSRRPAPVGGVDAVGSRRIGALVGSFDEFAETSFMISNAATIKVPEGVTALHLRIDDDAERYERHRGNGFAVQVVRTELEPWMLTLNPELGRTVRGDDVFVTLGSNLPTWIMRGERDTGQFIRIGDASFRVFESLGSFGYIVQEIR
jgi:hypothetical protein